MRILLVGQAFYRPDNGQAVFTIRLAEGLAAAGHTVWVLAPSQHGLPAQKTVQNGVNIQEFPAVHLPHNTNVTLPLPQLITQTIARSRPDVIHVQDHFFLSRACLSAARKFQIPIVGTNHFLPDNWLDNLPIPAQFSRISRRVLWRQMLSAYNRLDAITTPTQTAVKILQRQDIKGMIPLEAISCGIDMHEFHPRPTLNREQRRLKFGLDPHKRTFLFVGRIDREKNLELLINAWAAAETAHCQLAIAGKGSYLRSLKQLIAAKGVGESVKTLGYVPTPDLPYLYNAADIFVMPGHAELQSIVTMEAMASGLPILAAEARALPELVGHEENGYLFDPQDVAELVEGVEFLASHQNLAQLAEKSLNRVKKHAITNIIPVYERWYQHHAAAVGQDQKAAYSQVAQTAK